MSLKALYHYQLSSFFLLVSYCFPPFLDSAEIQLSKFYIYKCRLGSFSEGRYVHSFRYTLLTHSMWICSQRENHPFDWTCCQLNFTSYYFVCFFPLASHPSRFFTLKYLKFIVTCHFSKSSTTFRNKHRCMLGHGCAMSTPLWRLT